MRRLLRVVKKTGLIALTVLAFLCRRLARGRESLVVFISVPSHGNLGDQAIVYAQHRFFQDMGCKNILEFREERYHKLKHLLKKLIRPSDVIVIDGGGNIGTLWREPEVRMREILTLFPDNPVFIFPQTAFYEDSEQGREELEITKKIYRSHSRLTVFCRDSATYDLFQGEFPEVESIYVPDMVLYITDAGEPLKRDDFLLCFRNDVEKITDESLCEAILTRLEEPCRKARAAIRETSTVILRAVCGKKRREKELREKWEEFSCARLVVTDRLHGMIFCAITGTPCVALDNKSHKIKNAYSWISHLPYIRFAETGEDVMAGIEYLLNDDVCYAYSRAALDEPYDLMKRRVRNELT